MMKRRRLQRNMLFCVLVLGFSHIVHAQSLSFNGSDTYVEVAANNAYNEASAFTVEAWIKLLSGGSGYIFSTQAWTGTGGNGIDFTIDGQNLKLTLGNGNWLDIKADTVTVPYDVWTYVAVVYNSSTAKLYINGVEKKSGDASGYIPTDGGALRIGDNPTWNPRIFNGQIDEVRFWNVARTAEEISDNMYTALGGTETGLIGYWNFNEGSGSVATDNSATANNGTIVNCTWAEDYNTNNLVDVAVTAASPPVTGYSLTSEETLTVSVKNNSSTAKTDIPISFILDGGTTVTEQIASLDAGQSVDYSFTQKLDLSEEKEYEIKVFTSLENDEVSDNDTLIFNVTNQHETSTSISNADNFLVYPSVVSEFLNIKISNGSSCAAISITDISGHNILKIKDYNIINGNTIQIDLRDLDNGLYIINISTNNNSYSQKILKSDL